MERMEDSREWHYSALPSNIGGGWSFVSCTTRGNVDTDFPVYGNLLQYRRFVSVQISLVLPRAPRGYLFPHHRSIDCKGQVAGQCWTRVASEIADSLMPSS